MSEYDLQFQADLEKAQALSIESLALEEFRRQRQLASSAGVPGDSNGSNGTQLASRRREDSEGAPPPALPPPPRRLSRGRSLLTEAPRSNGTSPTREAASDLISFTSPTSKTAPKDSHASLKEYIDQITKLGQQTEEITLSTPTEQPPSTMNNHNPYYGQRPPGYQYAQYNYHQPAYHHPSPYHHPPPHQQPYPIPPYPTTSYGMPSPMPNYNFYPATGQETPQQNPGSPVVASPGLYPNIPYSQTRMASPYVGYPPPTQVSIPQYNYNTTNMISRPSRPANLYPQLSQMHMYPPMPGNSSPSGNNNLSALAVKTEKNRDSVESNVSRKSSEVSIGSMESQDVLGSLPKSLNLIDFRKVHSGPGSVRVSVLEAFDPLLTDTPLSEYAVGSECSSSVYEEYDPLDFLYGETEMRDTPVYATISKRDAVILPSPPPKTIPTVPAITKRSTTNKLYDCIVQVRTKTYDNEHKAFLKMVLDVRNKFVHSDSDSNPGCVIASRGGGRYPPNTSIKLVVHADTDEPITFTSDVESTVDHVILTVVCSLDEDIREDMSGYMLRVWGAQEYLKPGSALSEYDYVRSCVRLEKDVTLVLQVARDAALARSERDDAMGARVSLEDLVPSQGAAALSFDNLSILLETLEGELSRAVGVTGAEGTCSPTGVFQAVKAICALAGGVETLHVTHTLNAFAQSCSAQGNNVVTPEILSDNGEYCAVSIRGATAREAVSAQCTRVRDAVRSLLALYTRNTILDFRLAEQHLTSPGNIDNAIESHKLSESTLFCIEAIHSLPPCWNHDEYVLHAQIHYGTRALNRLHTTQPSKVESAGFYPRIIFDTWLNLEDMPVQSLARESRLVLTLYGRTQRAVDSQQAADAPANPQHAPDAAEQFDTRELAWTALQLFDIDGMLASGNYILPLWPVCVDKRTGPAPHPGHAPPQPYPVVNIEVPLYAHGGVKWSADSRKCKQLSRAALPAFDSLDGSTQSQLLHLVEQGAYQRMPTECREVLWEKRQYLVELPGALPLVLLAATNWSPEHRSNLVSLVKLWARPSPINAMHLLLPCFPDAAVREVATEIMSSMSDDDFRRVLPQLAQALRHETHDASALAALLLTRALSSPPVALALFWHLTHSLPNVPQAPNQEFLGITLEDNGGASQEGDPCMAATGRYRLLLRALLATCGENLSRALISQQLLVKTLSDVAFSVKAAKEGMRQRALTSGMEQLASLVRGEPSALPLGLACTVHDVDVKSCSYFSSNTLPLKVNFVGTDNAVIPAMFKVGDDLRQDALVLQVMRVMDNLWLKAGLDLRMVTFQAVPTNNRRGMIEIVSEAETLRAIQTEWGLTGSFKDKPIAEWLAKHNPSELEYQRARDNFTASCAGYSVATYLLGICDRHNDNIMLKTSGHLFHIDFGKFLGDAQMFGNFKRDRAPFVLTSDMVYVINGGERPTQRFQHFVELCCMAFNIVRAHHDHVLDLFALMASSGVPGVTSAAVNYVRAALMPGVSNAEAAAAFAKLIHSSLKSKFTPINFFLHNLAQLRASGDQGSNSSDLLSFIPRTYTMAQEGRLVNVECLGYEKRYDPEKHYVYALRVHRQGQSTPAVLYRSYKHFTELYQKICLHFPLAKVHCLPSGLHVGRSNTRIVAERRFGDVQAFLQSLFNLADEIAHSDLVYTFFHPLLRDQQDVEPQRMKHKAEPVEAEGSGSGSLKLSVQYSGGVLSVLILHAQSLALTPQGLPPNPYVKVYLVPDPNKETKRKTRVLKRNSHPSFMDMLEYRLPLEVIKTRSLQATVWNYDSLQENQFLGGVVVPLATLPLREETVAWYPLEYIPR